MKKFFSLLKATTKGDMKVFKIKGNNKNKLGNLILFIFLSLMMMMISYSYSNILGEPLHKVNLTYVLLTLFSLAIVVLNMFETIYKAQGIIFDAKDNNLLFSLPIKKSYILRARIIKLLAYDYIFEILFLLPCFFRYALYEVPGISFYILSLIFLIILPFIPVIVGCILAYIIKALSSLFKNKKLVQTVISLVLFFGFYALYFNMEGFVNNIASSAKSINDLISKIYLPIGLYVDLIQKFDFIKLIELLVISILPFILFIYIFQLKYDSIINNSKESASKKSKKQVVIKSQSNMKALVLKELKTYFSIPVYVINTIIGPIMAVFASIAIIVKYDTLIKAFTTGDGTFTLTQINAFIPIGVIALIMLLTAMTSITSSSVSLEGKKLDLMKSLPVEPYKILLSKVIMSDIIIIPFMILSALILIIRFKIFSFYTIFILLICIIFPHLTGEIGILANLKFPKLDFNSEVEVVKQSIAVLASLMICLILCAAIMFSFNYVSALTGNLIALIIYFAIFILITYLLNNMLKNYGTKKFNEL